MMKTLLLTGLLAAATLAHTGCKSPHYADHGAGLGALGGAALGAAIGENNGNALAGAVAGAAVGTMAGSAIGHSIDEDLARQRAAIENQIGRELASAATIPDVVAMSQSGVSDPVIIAYVQKSGLANKLNAPDVLSLQQQGVSQNVITAMINAPLAAQQVGYQQPAPPPRPVVVREHVYVGPGYHCYPPRRRYYHRHHHRRDPGVHLGFHFD